MDVLEAIRNRTSARTYTGEHLTKDEIDALLQAGLRAPSSGNLLHCSIIRISDQTVKDTLCRICFDQQFIRLAPLALVFNADQNRNRKWIEQFGGYFHFGGPAYLGKGRVPGLETVPDSVVMFNLSCGHGEGPKGWHRENTPYAHS